MIRIQQNSIKLMNKNVVFVISVRLRLMEQGELFALTGNALERVQRVHEPADLWDITF